MNEIIILSIEQVRYDNVSVVNHPVILKSDKEMVLVDCGFPDSLSKIKEAAQAQSANLDNLTRVVITHQDLDHVGSLKELKSAYPDLKIFAHIEEIPHIKGEKEPIKAKKLREMYENLPENQKDTINSIQRLYSTYEPVDVDGVLHDHDIFPWCGDVEIISTPGHTNGHISLYLHEFKTLIAGDALFVQNGELVISPPMFTMDAEQAKKSVRKLLGYEIEKIICYHGGVYEGDIKDALKKILMS